MSVCNITEEQFCCLTFYRVSVLLYLVSACSYTWGVSGWGWRNQVFPLQIPRADPWRIYRKSLCQHVMCLSSNPCACLAVDWTIHQASRPSANFKEVNPPTHTLLPQPHPTRNTSQSLCVVPLVLTQQIKTWIHSHTHINSSTNWNTELWLHQETFPVFEMRPAVTWSASQHHLDT